MSEMISTVQQQCGRARGHSGPHAVEAPGERGAACLAPAGEVQARTDVVCVAGGEVHRVDVTDRVACAPSVAVTWRSDPGDVVATLVRAARHHLCRTCFPPSSAQ